MAGRITSLTWMVPFLDSNRGRGRYRTGRGGYRYRSHSNDRHRRTAAGGNHAVPIQMDPWLTDLACDLIGIEADSFPATERPVHRTPLASPGTLGLWGRTPLRRCSKGASVERTRRTRPLAMINSACGASCCDIGDAPASLRHDHVMRHSTSSFAWMRGQDVLTRALIRQGCCASRHAQPECPGQSRSSRAALGGQIGSAWISSLDRKCPGAINGITNTGYQSFDDIRRPGPGRTSFRVRRPMPGYATHKRAPKSEPDTGHVGETRNRPFHPGGTSKCKPKFQQPKPVGNPIRPNRRRSFVRIALDETSFPSAGALRQNPAPLASGTARRLPEARSRVTTPARNRSLRAARLALPSFTRAYQ